MSHSGEAGPVDEPKDDMPGDAEKSASAKPQDEKESDLAPSVEDSDEKDIIKAVIGKDNGYESPAAQDRPQGIREKAKGLMKHKLGKK